MFEHAWQAQRFVEGIYTTHRLRRVEELLLAWGESETSYRGVVGYSPHAAGAKLAQSGMQYMSTSEVVEARDRSRVVEEVEACVDGLPSIYAAVLRAIYANTAGGAAFESPVLMNYNREGIRTLCRRAVDCILPALRRRGLGIE